MRISFIRAQLSVGGVEINQLELSRLFVSSGFDVDVWTYGGNSGWMVKRYIEGGVSLRSGLPEDSNVYDVIIVMAPSWYYPLLERFKGKLYCIIGNKQYTYYSKEVEERLKITGCICDSQDTVDFVSDITPNINCFKWFYMKPPEILDVKCDRSLFGLPTDALVFGTMCNLGEKKRVDRIISAYSQALKQGMKNTHLAIAGDGPVRAKLQSQASAQLPEYSYTFVGNQPTHKTGAFLSTLDCFLTSHAGNQGGICMCANEAIGAGCYLIVGDVGGIKENILHPDFGTLLPDSELDEMMPQEMLQFSVHGRQILDTIKSRVISAYQYMYDGQKGIVEWIQK